AMAECCIRYAYAPVFIIKAVTGFASLATSTPTSISAYATISVYTNAQSEQAINEMKEQFSIRLNRLHELLNEIPGIHCKKPHGAFYVFPNVSEAVELTGFESVDEWCKALLEEELVAIVPGSGFGSPENVRLSYATSLHILEEAAKRIKG